MYRKIFFISVIFSTYLLSTPVDTVFAVSDLYPKALTLETLDSLLTKIPDRSDQVESALGWRESRNLSALIESYRLGGNTAFLDEFLRRFDNMMKNRDDVRKKEDTIRKRILKGWGEVDDLPYHIRLVQMGNITQPMALFVRTVREDQTRLSSYNPDAQRVLKAVLEGVEEFDKPSKGFPRGEWVSKGNGDNEYGYYLEVSGDYAGKPNAFNRSLALGRTFLELDRIRNLDSWGKERVVAKWGNRAEQMARFFKKNLETGKYTTGGETYVEYIWTYSPNGERYEDISHGAVDMSFVLEAYRAGVVFTKSDLRRFYNTFFIGLRKGDSVSAVDGHFIPKAVGRNKDQKDRTEGICDGLVGLAIVNFRAAEACYDWIYNDGKGDSSHLDKVRLLNYLP